ncbi:ScbA/BarX family gamma-butyrolactone biosynthesis protein [Streptomyces subrutilus]|uniref:ScbA/BarX family gamma-butyrolactone biosynthesis protein n=1 Tax=Streptomyces subrutilus TaxID=36818 RepID=UPI002E1295C4|nr:hypothetical protein OG479_31950 [Streptomyces subrutilus]
MSATIATSQRPGGLCAPHALRSLLATSIPRQYVHKTAQSEVLLTGWFPLGPDRFRVTARWPAGHSFYGPVYGHHDPLLIAETVRQAVPLLSHAAYDVPFGHRQTWHTFRYAADPAALAATGAPAEVEMDITCSDVVRRGSRLVSVHLHVELSADGARLGTVETGFANLAPAVYRRLRGPYADIDEAVRRAVPLAPPVPPRQVARTDFADVVLSPTNDPHRTQLRVDRAHPALFDHPVDHAPGMLLLEAARQATHAVAHPRAVIPTGMDVLFAQYVEFDAPCWIQAEALADGADDGAGAGSGERAGSGAGRVRVRAVQNGVPAFTALVTTAPVSLPAAAGRTAGLFIPRQSAGRTW